jgi:hypothetical protein
MIYLTFLAAILLSGIAAYYSIIGLAAIFVGAFWPVVFMASSMEFAKLVTASWVYRNWKTAPKMLLAYLTIAIVILMLITSMGIFGFLAKAHIDSTLDAGANTVELKTLNTQQKITEERLNYLLARAKDPSTASNRLDKQIQDTQKELTEINKKRLPLLKEENKLVADIGPIKYVADMFFEGDSAVDKAVRLVILLIMLVFDPLAVLLLIAGNISLKQREVVVENGLITTFRTKTVMEPPKEEVRIDESQPNTKEEAHESVEVDKENIATIEEKVETQEKQIVIDPVSGETIPPLTVHLVPGVYEEHHDVAPEVAKKLEPKYDYDDEFAFRKKSNTTTKLDGGDF